MYEVKKFMLHVALEENQVCPGKVSLAVIFYKLKHLADCEV